VNSCNGSAIINIVIIIIITVTMISISIMPAKGNEFDTRMLCFEMDVAGLIWSAFRHTVIAVYLQYMQYINWN